MKPPISALFLAVILCLCWPTEQISSSCHEICDCGSGKSLISVIFCKVCASMGKLKKNDTNNCFQPPKNISQPTTLPDFTSNTDYTKLPISSLPPIAPQPPINCHHTWYWLPFPCRIHPPIIPPHNNQPWIGIGGSINFPQVPNWPPLHLPLLPNQPPINYVRRPYPLSHNQLPVHTGWGGNQLTNDQQLSLLSQLDQLPLINPQPSDPNPTTNEP